MLVAIPNSAALMQVVSLGTPNRSDNGRAAQARQLRAPPSACCRTYLCLLHGRCHCRVARSSLFRFNSRAGPGLPSRIRGFTYGQVGTAPPTGSRAQATPSSARRPTIPTQTTVAPTTRCTGSNRDRIHSARRAPPLGGLDARSLGHFGVHRSAVRNACKCSHTRRWKRSRGIQRTSSREDCRAEFDQARNRVAVRLFGNLCRIELINATELQVFFRGAKLNRADSRSVFATAACRLASRRWNTGSARLPALAISAGVMPR